MTVSVTDATAEPARPATRVPDDRRTDFLPRLFGARHFLFAEPMVYNFMNSLSPLDYRGGFWDFYEWGGQPLYLAPVSTNRFRIVCHTNDFEGVVSADAAGIIATFFTFSHLSFKFRSDRLSDGYARLYDYVAEHPEASEIFQAID